jgi:hypothetical protein
MTLLGSLVPESWSDRYDYASRRQGRKMPFEIGDLQIDQGRALPYARGLPFESDPVDLLNRIVQ